jgi:hypothetical protein
MSGATVLAGPVSLLGILITTQRRIKSALDRLSR